MENKYRTLCIFSSFDKHNVVQPYVFHLVRRLNTELDCTRFLFVSTSRSLAQEDADQLQSYGAETFTRENLGYDFGSYFYGLDLIGEDLNDYDRVFFVNDSVYGPFNDIEPITRKFDQFDYWGLTDSWQHAYHLQSYFLCVQKNAFKELLEFKKNYIFPNDYMNVVQLGEIGLSQYMLSKGKHLCCAFPVEKLLGSKLLAHSEIAGKMSGPTVKRLTAYARRKIMNVNPCSVFWRSLLKHGHPFLKRKHFTRQDTFIEHYGFWLSEINSKYEDSLRYMYSNVVAVRSATWDVDEKKSSSGIIFRLATKRRHRREIRRLAKAMRSGF